MIFKKTIAITLVTASVFTTGTVWAQTTFRVAMGDSLAGSQGAMTTKFKELFEQKTGGKYQLALFPSGQLGDEQDTVNTASLGNLDFSVLAVNNLTPFSPTVGILSLPYLIQSAEEAKKLTLGEVGDELVRNTVRDAKVRIVGWTYSGFRVLTNSKKPVRTVEDLQGLKIRVPRNQIMIASYRSWGVNPTPMSWNETFTALQQRVVDGQDNPYITISAMKFDQVQKYITNIRYIFSLEPIIMSESVFQRQPADVKKAILDAGKEASEYSYSWLLATEDRIKKELVSKGMEITDPADGEREFISRATQAVWPQFYNSIGGKDKLDRAVKLLGR